MKLSKDKSLFLSKIGIVRIYKEGEGFLDNFTDWMKEKPSNFTNNIQYISKSFYKSAIKASKVFEKIDVIESLCDFGDGAIIMAGAMYLYSIKNGEINILCHSVGEIAWVVSVRNIYSRREMGHTHFVLNPHYESFLKECHSITDDTGTINHLWEIIADILAIFIFIKYAPIETQIVNRNSSNSKTKKEGKIINEMDYDVKILDSRWFADIIRNEPFGVKGHFRLQPCGEGRKERELIYIKPFVKSGYHRRHDKEDIDMPQNDINAEFVNKITNGMSTKLPHAI